MEHGIKNDVLYGDKRNIIKKLLRKSPYEISRQQNVYCLMHFPEKITSVCGGAVTCRPLTMWIFQSRWRTQASICESVAFFYFSQWWWVSRLEVAFHSPGSFSNALPLSFPSFGQSCGISTYSGQRRVLLLDHSLWDIKSAPQLVVLDSL